MSFCIQKWKSILDFQTMLKIEMFMFLELFSNAMEWLWIRKGPSIILWSEKSAIKIDSYDPLVIWYELFYKILKVSHFVSIRFNYFLIFFSIENQINLYQFIFESHHINAQKIPKPYSNFSIIIDAMNYLLDPHM